MKKNIIISSILLATLMTGCLSSNQATNEDDNTSLLSDYTPIVPFDNTHEGTYCDEKIITKLGADGELATIEEDDYFSIIIKQDIDSITLSQVIENTYTKIESYEDNITIVEVANFATGDNRLTVTSDLHGNFTCTEHYNSLLPLTIINQEDELLEPIEDTIMYFDEENFISSDCPSWLDEISEISNMEQLTNVTVTNDETGTKSHISEYIYYEEMHELCIL